MSLCLMPATARATFFVATLAVSVALLAACAADGASTNRGGSDGPHATVTSAPSDEPFGNLDLPEVAGADERVQIGMAATRALNDFVASDRVVMGERTVVEMTRTPFLAMSAFTINPEDVQRVERRDDVNGVLIITLTNRTGVKTHLPALPRVEIGGMLFVGVEQLELRYDMKTDLQRPINLRAVAERKAVYQHVEAGRRERGGRVLLEMEILGTGDAAEFRENVRIDP